MSIEIDRKHMGDCATGKSVADAATSYSVYNEEVKVRTRFNWMDSLFPPLPNRQYDILYADPPWYYNGKLQFDKSGTAERNRDWSKRIFISSASFKYPTVPTDELKKLPVQQIAKDDSLLFLWTTNPHLAQAIELGIAWGFEYKTVAFVWNKMKHNPGHYTLSYYELCLLFKRGRIPTPRGARNVKQLIEIPRKNHSEKPVEIAQSIMRMFPHQSRIELFARTKKEGFDSWGLEVVDRDGKRFTGGCKRRARLDVVERYEGQLEMFDKDRKEGLDARGLDGVNRDEERYAR